MFTYWHFPRWSNHFSTTLGSCPPKSNENKNNNQKTRKQLGETTFSELYGPISKKCLTLEISINLYQKPTNTKQISTKNHPKPPKTRQISPFFGLPNGPGVPSLHLAARCPTNPVERGFEANFSDRSSSFPWRFWYLCLMMLAILFVVCYLLFLYLSVGCPECTAGIINPSHCRFHINLASLLTKNPQALYILAKPAAKTGRYKRSLWVCSLEKLK